MLLIDYDFGMKLITSKVIQTFIPVLDWNHSNNKLPMSVRFLENLALFLEKPSFMMTGCHQMISPDFQNLVASCLNLIWYSFLLHASFLNFIHCTLCVLPSFHNCPKFYEESCLTNTQNWSMDKRYFSFVVYHLS